MLSPVSLAHSRPRTRGSHPALQAGVPRGKRLAPHLSSGPCAEARRTALSPRWRRRAVCRDAAPDTELPGRPLRTPPLPMRPYKAALHLCVGEAHALEQARTCPYFDPRTTLSFASEPNSVSFCWLQGYRAGGPSLGSHSKGSVIVIYTSLQFLR